MGRTGERAAELLGRALKRIPAANIGIRNEAEIYFAGSSQIAGRGKTTVQDYESSVEIAQGIYWVGFHDTYSGLRCNPYLIIDHDEALVVDGGSRPDFATVMMNILQTGIDPLQIQALVYQHYDPDLGGSIPNFEVSKP